GRFTQEDSYNVDGLNLYAYCRNNPVYFADPSGNICEKAANRIREKIANGDPVSNNERKKLAAYERNEERKQKSYEVSDSNPYNWTTERLQASMDAIYMAGIEERIRNDKSMWNDGPRQTITITPNGTVVLTQNNGIIEPASLALAQKIFGENVIHPEDKEGGRRPGMKGNYGNHSETRGIFWLESHGYDTHGAIQVSSHNACLSCGTVQRNKGINNITGFASKSKPRIPQKRIDYLKILGLKK
ncbi:MAG: hypothetical protein K2N34_10475, partial [Lachnospiraceae bacterium]|nr:hypothetical protein [Lachnospiraceae bacterium]